MEQRLAQAHQDKRAAEVERDSVRCNKEQLTAKVNTMEGEARRAKGGRAPKPTPEGEAKSRRVESVVWGWGGGGAQPAGTRFVLAGALVWHAHDEAARTDVRRRHRPAHDAKLEVEVGMVAPNLGNVEQAHLQLVERYPPPPHRLMVAALDAGFGGEEQSSHGSAGRSCAGGRVTLPLTSCPE